MTFKEWMKSQDESFVVSPSIVDDERPEASARNPGAFPVYKPGDLPPARKKNKAKEDAAFSTMQRQNDQGTNKGGVVYTPSNPDTRSVVGHWPG